ncbi:hypothetical protein [Geothrix sp. PMB-07]|uniref:hypothetical protein n=1 Tax=Geothrix sp. PMB-07 TaxID=3068640 RepID=UPI0027406402|nr:hypothetical protein [Geothrix sp. PMB-07]WLT30666.1 hypothetical protein Q9293_13170 [Geothrix sp. PMB-07]
MRVSKPSRIERKDKPSKKHRGDIEISVFRISRGMTPGEAERVTAELREELTMTGIRIVRVPKILRPDMTIIALHWVRRADELITARVVQETRHHSLFVA